MGKDRRPVLELRQAFNVLFNNIDPDDKIVTETINSISNTTQINESPQRQIYILSQYGLQLLDKYPKECSKQSVFLLMLRFKRTLDPIPSGEYDPHRPDPYRQLLEPFRPTRFQAGYYSYLPLAGDTRTPTDWHVQNSRRDRPNRGCSMT